MTTKILKTVLLAGVLIAAVALGLWWLNFSKAEARTYEAEVGDVIVGVTVSGNIESREKTALAAEIMAVVDELGVEEGQRVEKGTMLVSLDDSVVHAEWAKARARLERARQLHAELKAGPRQEEIDQAAARLEATTAQFRRAREDYERIRRAHEQGAATDAERAQAAEQVTLAKAEADIAKARHKLLKTGTRDEEIARAAADVRMAEAEVKRIESVMAKYTLQAPHDGEVTAKHVSADEVVRPGQVLMHLHNVEELEVRAHAQETQIGGITVGTPAMVLPDAFPDRALEAEVVKILGRVDPASGTVTLLLRIKPESLRELTDESAGRLLDGMAADIALISERREGVVRVPSRAVRRDGTRHWVRVRTTVGTDRRDVHIGADDGQWTEITAGLEPGEVVEVR